MQKKSFMVSFFTEEWPDNSWYRDQNRDLLTPPTNTPPTPHSPRLSKEIKMQVTPSYTILLRLSVTQFAASLIIQQPVLLTPPPFLSLWRTPFSSLPPNYWWPWLQNPPSPPHPLTTTKQSPCHAVTMKVLGVFAQLCKLLTFTSTWTWKVATINIFKKKLFN